VIQIIGKVIREGATMWFIMAAEVAREALADEEYADAEYRRFLKEKDKYVDFDEFCRKEEI
jgi:hypothetical protein